MRDFVISLWRALAARPSFEQVNLFLFDCAVRGMGIMNWENDRVSGEDNFLRKLLPLYVEGNPPTIFDVGANRGAYSKVISDTIPGARLFSCEPNPKAFEILAETVPSAEKINKGLGETVSRLRLFDKEDADNGSPYATFHEEVITDIFKSKSIGIEVDVTTLDLIAEEYGVEGNISLVKVDTEGHEEKVLKGASALLRDQRVNLIHLEFNKMNVISRVFYRDFRNLLSDFVPYRLLPNGVLRISDDLYTEQSEIFGFQNIIFAHKRFAPDEWMRPTRR